jgi:MoxR-like ATPase
MLRTDIGQIQLKPLLEPTAVVEIRELIRNTYVDERLREYVVRLGRATRDPKQFGLDSIAEAVTVGVSPRAYHHILALAKTIAFFNERDYVMPADVKEVIPPALRHRIIRSVQAEAARLSTDDILEVILDQIPIP